MACGPNCSDLKATPQVEDLVSFDDYDCEIHLNITHNKFTSARTALGSTSHNQPSVWSRPISKQKYIIHIKHTLAYILNTKLKEHPRGLSIPVECRFNRGCPTSNPLHCFRVSLSTVRWLICDLNFSYFTYFTPP